MRSADRPSTHHQRPCVVSERLQVSEYPVSSSSAQSRDVLNEDPRRTTLGNEPRHFAPETGACSSDPGTLPGGRDVLAGEPAGDDVDSGKSVGVELSHVVESRDVGPVLGEYGSAEGIDFALGDDAHSGAFEPEVDSADSGKEREDIHSPISSGAGSAAIAASSSFSFSI